MEHRTTESFWRAYEELPTEIRTRADKQFALLKENPHHPSLQLKKIGVSRSNSVWSVRVTLNYRAVALQRDYGFLWFWIGDHEKYDTLIS